MGKKVTVIGGGIVGLSSAYYLHKEGHEVTVIDKSNMDSGASHVNAGYLTPSHIIPLAAPGMISKGLRYMFNATSPFYMKPRFDTEFIKWAWAFKKSSTQRKVAKAIPNICDINLLSRELYDAIKASKELGEIHYERKGLLMLFQTQKEGDHEITTAEKAKKLGLKSNVLDKTGIKLMEPNIDVNAIGAVHYLCDGHTTPNDIMLKMVDFLEKSGVILRKNEEVIDFKRQGDSIRFVKTAVNEYSCDEVVLAAGSWSARLSKKLGCNLLLQAGKGYRIDVSKSTGITMPALLLEAKIAVTPMLGYTRLAGTMEFSGVNHYIRKVRVNAIANGAKSYYEGLDIPKTDIDHVRCGLRPVSPDGLPYIGRTKNTKNLVLATGHAMMGWSLGPATGKLVSDIISHRKPSLYISPYDPDRKF